VRRLSVALVAAFALAHAAFAEWQVVSANNEPGAVRGVEHRQIVLRNVDKGANVTIDLALFSPETTTLRVIDNASGSENLAEAMARGKCAAGVNGGYFDPNFKPIGLRMIDGATTSPLTRARLLTGVLCASPRGIAILRLAEFSNRRKCGAAIESGPFLVDGGTGVKSLNDRRSARRTFAAVTRGGKAAFGTSSELTLAQTGAVLANRSLANDFRIWRAMNLDGGSSSAFWFRKDDGRIFSISEDKAVRDFVGVVEK
jgi:uncharacterized protein YigE (DUF2233 family)